VAVEAQQPPPYRILVSNDDGVRAPGLASVAQVLQAIGQVVIIAPLDNRSGSGHSISTRDQPVFREDLTLPNGLRAIGLTATPATTVNVAMRNILSPSPDLVVSGINRGLNLGYSVHASGTVGAAREAVMHGVPAIAASIAEEAGAAEYVFAAEEVLGVARRVKQYGLPPHTLLNVNIPVMPRDGYRGYLVTTQARQKGGDESFVQATHPSGRTVYWSVFSEGGNSQAGTDVQAVADGFVSVTPLAVGETDVSQIEPLRAVFE
jgi:5'-nucleotidase